MNRLKTPTHDATLRPATSLRAAICGIAAVLAMLASAGSASAFTASSVDDDGRVWFGTIESLTPDRTVGRENLYLRANGETTLLSRNVDGKPVDVQLAAVTAENHRVFVASSEDLTADDPAPGDGRDIYELRDGKYRLVSTGPTDGPGQDSRIDLGLGISDDGEYVYFETYQRLVAGDQDKRSDVYLRHNGTTQRLSVPDHERFPPPHEGDDGAHLMGISADGRTAYLVSYDPLTPDDTEPGLNMDIFAWRGGTLTRITPDSDRSDYSSSYFGGASRDGSRFFFTSRAQLTGNDNDDDFDEYMWQRGSGFRLISTAAGARPCADRFCSAEPNGVSRDGSRAFFYTLQPMIAADKDTKVDTYMWEEGKGLTLITEGLDGGKNFDNYSGTPSLDGRRFAITTEERLTEEDRDDTYDVYLWVDGRIILASPAGEGPDKDVSGIGFSPSGNHLLFQTFEQTQDIDADSRQDIYDAQITFAPAARAAAPGAKVAKRRRLRRRIRLITVESIPPRFSIAKRGGLGGEAAHVFVGCSRKERSGPCRGKLTLRRRSGKLLGAAHFRVRPGKRTLVAVPLRTGKHARRLVVVARLRGRDRVGNRASARGVVALSRR